MILYFSGTGNSRAVAEAIAAKTGDSLFPICSNGNVTTKDSGSRFIWVFPTYCWDIPPIVTKYMESAYIGDNTIPHFMVTTCGDDIGLAALNWRKICKKRGWNPKGAFSIQMPNNYVCMKGFDVDPKHLEQQKLRQMKSNADEIAKLILSEESGEHTVRGSFSWIKTRIIAPVFHRYYMNPRDFNVDKSTCISCSKCQRECPCSNIDILDGHPIWRDNCAFCLRCYHICPTHAIAYKNRTSNKGQYLLK